MEREEMRPADYDTSGSDSFFEIEFDDEKQPSMDEDKKQRIRQELMSLEW